MNKNSAQAGWKEVLIAALFLVSLLAASAKQQWSFFPAYSTQNAVFSGSSLPALPPIANP